MQLGMFILVLLLNRSVHAGPALLLGEQDPIGKSPLAAVYNGPGACPEGCATAAAAVVRAKGIRVRYVTPQMIDKTFLDKIQFWLQPGGDAIQVANNFSAQQKEDLRDWIFKGGRYMGFCAGAFFADSTVDDDNKIPGLGVIPGTSYDYIKSTTPYILLVNWMGSLRDVFFQEGPSFKLQAGYPVNTIARYSDGSPAVISFRYGAGHVVLSGPHPEAPDTWAKSVGLVDRDGPDLDLAGQLMHSLAETLR